MTARIRVLVVDDSSFMRAAVQRVLASDPRLEVVGQAKDGEDAVAQVKKLRPDVVTMDFNMPRMNGAEAVRAILRDHPTPVVMLSAHTLDGARETMEALAAGAVDFLPKPAGEVSVDLSAVRDALIEKVVAAAASRPRAPRPALPPPPRPSKEPRVTRTERVPQRTSNISLAQLLDPAVIVAVSTGGPAALERVLPMLPKDFSAGMLVVQHMPAHFTAALAERLDRLCQLRVREARDGDRISAGTILFAPGDQHVIVDRSGSLKLLQTAPVNGCRPSADVTLQSAAPIYGARLCGVVMTGMGRDGATGLAQVRALGGRVVAQDRETSVVWGMPKAAVDSGVVEDVVALDELPQTLRRIVGDLDL